MCLSISSAGRVTVQTQRVGMNHFDYVVAEEILTKGTGEQWQHWNLNTLLGIDPPSNSLITSGVLA